MHLTANRLQIKDMRPGLELFFCAVAGSLLALSEKRMILVPAGCGLLAAFCFAAARFRLASMRWLLPLVYLLACGQIMLLLWPSISWQKETGEGYVVIRGRVLTLADERQRMSRVIVRLDNRARVSLFAPSEQLSCGAVIEAPVLLTFPERERNPGGFSPAAWMRGQGVLLQADLSPGAQIRQISAPPSFRPQVWAARQRAAIHKLLSDLTGKRYAGIISALLLGDKSQMSPEDREYFRRAGIAHLAAVSGTHLALLLLPAEQLLQRLGWKTKAKSISLLLLLGGYCILAGWPISLTRAALMYAFIIGGRLLSRRTDPLNLLACAALLLLLLKPFSILNAGFWMSVLATASLVLWSRPLTDYIKAKLPFVPGWLAPAVGTSLCAQLAVLPLSVGLSGEMTVAAVAGNILAAPLLQLILLFCLLLIPAALVLNLFFQVPFAHLSLLAAPLRHSVQLFWGLARYLALIQIGRWQTGRINLALWLCLYSWPAVWTGFLSKLAAWLRLSPHRAGKFLAIWRLTAAGAGIAVILLTSLLRPPLQVWFFDVGQGDAILMRTRDGKTVLVDGGKSGCGLQVLLPALNHLGIGRIDLAVATHGHDDHLGGIIDLLAMRRVKNVVFPGGLVLWEHRQSEWQAAESFDQTTDELVHTALKLAKKMKVGVQTWRAHDTIFLNSQVQLQVLYPPEDSGPDQAHLDGNEFSMVLMVDAGGQKMLLTGDSTPRIEAKLLERPAALQADLLKVAHHGSGLSSTDDFLQTVQPELAVISVGSNPYGHPAPAVLRRLEQTGSRFWRTDCAGAVTWQIWPDRWVLQTMLEPLPAGEKVG